MYLLLVCTLIGCKSPEVDQSVANPNVILFLIDDYGYGDISYEGNTQITTPNMDRIATQGARFTRFYQSSGACAPTRASLLTGRYYLETGVWGVHFGRDFLLRDEVTIADVLQQAGYTTGAFGKWHSGKTWSYYSWSRGFDVGIHPVLYKYWDSRIIYNNKIINFDGPVTDVVADQVVRFIEQNKERPFFAYVPFQSIHEPFNCPEAIFQKFKAQGYSDHVARLYGMIEVLDINIGKILNTVEEYGIEENTVIMFAVDDGPSPGVDLTYTNRRMNAEERAERERGWGKKLRGGKANIYEGGSVSPFYIQWKNQIKPGLEYGQLSGVIDLFPTILDICNVDKPKKGLPIRGQSIWPILQDEDVPDWENRMYFDNTNFYRIPRWTINMDHPEMREMSVHYKDYKLIRNDRTLYGEDTVFYELYDLKTDPEEQLNTYSENENVGKLLKNEVEQWYEDMLKTGRAFGQAVYEIGNWEEIATPINLDAVRKISGSVKKSAQSEFRFEGWSALGSSMTFDIDVAEEGSYAVELVYSCAPDNFGAIFEVFTEFDTSEVYINHEHSTVSDPLNLPKGKQHLTIQLKKPGPKNAAIDVLQLLIVHRIPNENDHDLLTNPEFVLLNNEETVGHYSTTNSVADMMQNGGKHDELMILNEVQTLKVQAGCDNIDQLKRVDIYLDFEKIETKYNPPFDFYINPPKKGKYTLNVEFTSKKGIKNAARAYLEIN